MRDTHGEEVTHEGRQLVFADPRQAILGNGLQGELGSGQQRHHAALAVHVIGGQQRDRYRLQRLLAAPQKVLVGDVEHELALHRAIQEYADGLVRIAISFAAGGGLGPVGHTTGGRLDAGHLGVLGSLELE